MAHFAEIDNNNIVLRVLVCDAIEWLQKNLGGTWIQTSYNTIGGEHILGGTPLRKNFAGAGFTYDHVRDAFIPPKPFNSWVLNEETCLWESPIPYPSDGLNYRWDENNNNWEVVNELPN